MSGLSYYVADIETTGLNSKNFHEITEVSFIRATDRVQLFREVRCEHPENANYDALKITGKTLADLNNGISKEAMIDEVNRFLVLDGSTPMATCIVGHNISFDRRFLFAYWERQGKKFPAYCWLDTQMMVKQYLKQTDTSALKLTKTATGKTSTTLTACCEMLGVKKYVAAHNAQADTRNTYFLWKTLTEECGIDHLPFIKTNIHRFEGEPETPNAIDFDPNADIETNEEID
jgi:DNA polymerase III epsilon subunit-like protein